jgi:hypothetical protein
VLPNNDTNSPGFNRGISSTWTAIGNFTLTAVESVLGYFGGGVYGTDTITWGDEITGPDETTSPELRSQVVATTVNLQWWIGMAGLGPKAVNFTSFQEPYDSYLSRLVNLEMISGLSWAYTAGAAYRGRAPASLTLGGYDTSRFVAPGISLNMYADDSRPFTVAVISMPAQNTLAGNLDLSTTGRYFLLDSAVPHVWVPQEDIPRWVAAFGLIYDNTTNLFLVNDTTHARLRALNPTITFTLSHYAVLPTGLSNQPGTLDITLPYAAFDLQASYPYYVNATNYFPIRIAANSTQYIIGRTFLQEAYIIADYDRGNFTVAQARPPSDSVPSEIVTITPPADVVTLGSSGGRGSSSPLSAAATGGLLGGLAVLVLLLAALAALFIRRRRKQRRAQNSSGDQSGVYHRAELGCDGPTLCEAPNDKTRFSGHDTESMSEADGGTYKSVERKVVIHELPGTPVGHETGLMAEIPGCEGVRPELEDIRKFSFERERRD